MVRPRASRRHTSLARAEYSARHTPCKPNSVGVSPAPVKHPVSVHNHIAVSSTPAIPPQHRYKQRGHGVARNKDHVLPQYAARHGQGRPAGKEEIEDVKHRERAPRSIEDQGTGANLHAALRTGAVRGQTVVRVFAPRTTFGLAVHRLFTRCSHQRGLHIP